MNLIKSNVDRVILLGAQFELDQLPVQYSAQQRLIRDISLVVNE